MNLRDIRNYYNNKPVEFLIKENYELLEDNEYLSKFSLKNVKEISNIPINEPIKYSDEVAIKAIKYGMIFLINYKGAKDTHFSGHERVLYFMVLGKSSKGKTLLRAWHLNGWSVSNKRHINKIWRLFRTDRILSMTFTGSFYRLPPTGYNAKDKGMTGGIIISADFNQIRNNQQTLISQNKIQDREEITLGSDERKFASVQIRETNTILDLNKPFENAHINSSKNKLTIRITFLKSIYGNKYVAILGALGQPGNTVKIFNKNNKEIGVFKCIGSINGKILKSIKNIRGNNIYDLYIFNKKI